MFAFQSGGKTIHFIKAASLHRLFNGLTAVVTAEDGTQGQLLITMTPKQHILVRLSPPLFPIKYGDRLRIPRFPEDSAVLPGFEFGEYVACHRI
jgi:hypothetical protein